MTTCSLHSKAKEAWGEVQTFFRRFAPLGGYAGQAVDAISTIASSMMQGAQTTYLFLSKFTDKVPLIGVIFVPLRIHNIFKTVSGENSIKNKAVDILIELGGIFNATISMVNWSVKNIKNIGPYLPYLVGFSTVFQVIDVYKKSMNLIRTKNAAQKLSTVAFDELYQRIKEKKLEAKDKRLLEVSFRFDCDKIEGFCDEVAQLDDKEKVRSHLKERVSRALISHRVLLVAAIVETIASGLILCIFFVAPPIGALLSITNSSLLGSTALTKMAIFLYDQTILKHKIA